jgi:hypothetical protein
MRKYLKMCLSIEVANWRSRCSSCCLRRRCCLISPVLLALELLLVGVVPVVTARRKSVWASRSGNTSDELPKADRRTNRKEIDRQTALDPQLWNMRGEISHADKESKRQIVRQTKTYWQTVGLIYKKTVLMDGQTGWQTKHADRRLLRLSREY